MTTVPEDIVAESIPNGLEEKRLIRRDDVLMLLGGIDRSTLYAWIGDGEFPKPVRLAKRAVAWRASDIEAWLDARPTT